MKSKLFLTSLIIFSNHLIGQQTLNCICNTQFSPQAQLNINGVNYFSNSINSPAIVPTITLPPGTQSSAISFSLGHNVPCKPVNGLGTCLISSKINVRIQNMSTIYIRHTTNTINFPNSSLPAIPPGTNTITVYADCSDGSSSTSSTPCAIGSFKITIVASPPLIPSGNINLIQECCTSAGPVSGTPPRPTTIFTGKVKFKMTGSMANSMLKIVSNGNNYYENFVQNGYTQCYNLPVVISIVDISNNPVPNSTINNNSSYVVSNRFNKQCINFRYRDRFNYLIRVSTIFFKPKIEIEGLGDLVDKTASGLNISLEMILPNRKGLPKKLIPAIEISAGYDKLNFDNGLSLLQKKFPALSAGESRMAKSPASTRSNRMISVSILPKIVIPMGKLNLSVGTGISYFNHSIPGLDVQDELIKTNNGQALEYASSSCCRPPNVRGGFGGDFRLGFSFWLSKLIAVNAGAGYLLGTTHKTKLNLLNAPDVNNDGLYSSGELRNGNLQLTEYKYSLNALRLSAGITVALQSRHAYNGHVTLIR